MTSRRLARGIGPTLLAALLALAAGTARAEAVAREETVTGLAGYSLPELQGGTDQTYVVFIVTENDQDVTGVSGGGLTWTERVEQCGAKPETGIRVWTAQGSPASAFPITIEYDLSTTLDLAAVALRYSGVASIADPTGENTNGEGGVCDDGAKNKDAQLTLTSTVANSLHLVGVSPRDGTVNSFSSGYTDLGNHVNDKARVHVYEQAFASGTTDTFQATLDADKKWATGGLVLEPSGSIVRQETVTGFGGYALPTVQGGTDQTYVLFLTSETSQDVTGVAGGGLSWTEQIEQCGAKPETGVRIWTAQGSPSAAFQAAVTYDLSSNMDLSVVLSRYSNVSGFEGVAGENNNGPNGVCDDGPKDKTVQLTLTSTQAYPVHVIGVSPQDGNFVGSVAGYTLLGEDLNDKARSRVYERAFSAATTDQLQVSIDADKKWAAAGLVLLPTGGGPPPSCISTVFHEETVSANGDTTALTLPSIEGGDDQTYVMAVMVKDGGTVSSVTGGGLTWTKRVDQCGRDSKVMATIWTAQGSPGSAFQAQLTLAAKAKLNVVLTRYTGVGAFEDPVGENVNGEGGACSGGSNTASATLTLTSSKDDSVHFVAVGPKDQSVDVFDPSDAIFVGSEIFDKARVHVYQKKFASPSSQTYTATLGGNVEWAMAGLVLQPAEDCGVKRFVLNHDGSGIHCLGETVTVTGVDIVGNPVTDYTGSITLDTQSGKGTWADGGNAGSFSDATSNDGLASYTFDDTDDGVAGFTLSYTEGATPIDIHVYQTDAPTITDDDTEGTLAWAASGFTVTASALSNPPPNPINDPIANQTAGTNFTLHLAAYGTTATDPECGIIETYDGDKDLKFWSAYNDPSSGTRQVSIDTDPIATAEGSAAAQTVTFSNGQASVTAKYKDAGRIQISLKDDTVSEPVGGIAGATNFFVSKPADFFITAIERPDTSANPGATTPSGTIFVAAGDPFRVTVETRDAEGDVTPNYGNESSAEGLLLTASTLVAPVGGRNGSADDGAIGNGTAFSAIAPAGTFRGTTFSWDEVGAVKLRASVGDGDYLGAGDVAGTESGDVGRFTPRDFAVALSTPEFTTGCAVGTFTYLGQAFDFSPGEEPVITVTARATGGTTTRNYTGSWWKLTNTSLANRTYSAASGSLDTSGLPATSSDPAIVDSGGGDPTDASAGSGTLSFDAGSGLRFTRAATPVAPFDAEIALSIDVLDDDGIAYASNPASFGTASPGAGIAFSTGKTLRYGRIAIANAHDSELLDVAVPLRAQYWDGSAFVPNGSDSCSAIAIGNLLLTKDPLALPSAPDPTPYNDPLLAGDAGLVLTAPGAGNPGTVDLLVDLSATGANLEYLRWDWLSDGGMDGVPDDDPIARITFGIYAGSDSVIFVRELY